MINEHLEGEVCRSPTSPPSKDSLRIGPGRAPPRILRGTRPGCSAAAAAASEHKVVCSRPSAPCAPPSALRPGSAVRCAAASGPASLRGCACRLRRHQRPAPVPVAARLAWPIGACARPPLRRLPPPVRRAAGRAAARPGAGPARAALCCGSPLGCSGLAALALRAAAGSPPPCLRLAAAGAPPPPPLRGLRGGCAAACPSRLRRGAFGGAAPRFLRPPAPRLGGLGRRCGGVAALRQLGGSAAGIQSVATLKARQGGPGIHAIRYALASPHSQSLSAKAYSNVTSGRSCCNASCTLRRS